MAKFTTSINYYFLFLVAATEAQNSQTVPLAIGVSAGVVIVLLIILGLIYLRL